MSQIRGVEFGMFYWKNPNQPILNYDQAEAHVYDEAVAHACPARNAVVEKFGAEWTLERYASCNIVMEKLVFETAERLNPKLLKMLTTPVPRLEGEPVGDFEEGAVPESHLTEMSPGSTSYGYSLPRVIVAAIGRGNDGRLAIKHERLPAIADMVEHAIEVSKTPYELLARIAQGSVTIGADSTEVLGHIFAQGIIKEGNCVTQYKEIETELEKNAPTLWTIYSQMSASEKRENDMWVNE